jgi:hypothetical protein
MITGSGSGFGSQVLDALYDVGYLPDHTAIAVEDLDAAPGVPHSILRWEPTSRQVFLTKKTKK